MTHVGDIYRPTVDFFCTVSAMTLIISVHRSCSVTFLGTYVDYLTERFAVVGSERDNKGEHSSFGHFNSGISR